MTQAHLLDASVRRTPVPGAADAPGRNADRPARRPRLRALLRLSAALATALLLAVPAAATTVTLSQTQLLGLDEVTSLFGGNGQVLSRTADGAGVLFEIQGGTIDYGKVALRLRLQGADLTSYDDFGLHVDVLSAPSPVEVNPFVQTGTSGTTFVEDVPGVKAAGDSFDTSVALAGVTALDDAYALGFQYFTAGGVVDPAAQTVLIRVSPIAGADYAVPLSSPPPVPEPATPLLVLLAGGALGLRRRARRARPA